MSEAESKQPGSPDRGRAILHAAHFAEDLQYGMPGVANNLGLLSASLGLAPALTTGAILAQLIHDHWDKILDAINRAPGIPGPGA